MCRGGSVLVVDRRGDGLQRLKLPGRVVHRLGARRPVGLQRVVLEILDDLGIVDRLFQRRRSVPRL